jgi:ATPase
MIPRDLYLHRLVAAKHNGLIKIITGVRRCGKSTLLFELFPEHLRAAGVDEDHIVKVDLEDRRNRPLRDADALLAYIDAAMQDGGMYYILIDEVQHVPEFTDVLNSYLKVKNADVYVTGSNSRFLSKDVATEFRGRGLEIRVAPLCFREFFSAFPGTQEQALQVYMTYGGLPQLLALNDDAEKISYLQSLFDTTYLKDIQDRYAIRNEAEFNELLDILASSIGALTNPTKLSHTFSSVKHASLSANTISSYLDILDDVFLLEKSVRYDIKGKAYIDSPFKCYFTDLGLRNARINFRQYEVSHLMENLLYNELRVRGLAVDVGVVVQHTKDAQGRSQRRQLEVDFVCNRGSNRCYIQSALRLATPEKREQELRSLQLINDSFMKLVITEDPIKTYQDNEGIVFMNIFDFLLHEGDPL